MSSPTVSSSMADWGTTSGDSSAPRMSIAEVMLMTGRSTGPVSSSESSAASTASSVMT